MNLVLFLTYKCNLNCKYCFVKKQQDIMTLETYINVINKCKDRIKHIIFFGGEPLLRYDTILEIIKYNNDNNINVSYTINTNALLLNDSILNFCKNNKILLNVSLDGNKESNILNRCNEEQFELILSNIKKAVSYKIRVIVNYVVTPNNVEFFYEGIKFLLDNNINEICLMFDYDAVWKKINFDVFKNQYYKMISLMYERKFKLYPFESKLKSLLNNEQVTKCRFGKQNIVANPSGELFPCMSFLDNYQYKIDDQEIEFENTTDVSRCLKCNYVKYCVNNCMCKNTKKNIDSEIDANCEFEKLLIKSALDYSIKVIDDIL